MAMLASNNAPNYLKAVFIVSFDDWNVVEVGKACDLYVWHPRTKPVITRLDFEQPSTWKSASCHHLPNVSSVARHSVLGMLPYLNPPIAERNYLKLIRSAHFNSADVADCRRALLDIQSLPGKPMSVVLAYPPVAKEAGKMFEGYSVMKRSHG